MHFTLFLPSIGPNAFSSCHITRALLPFARHLLTIKPFDAVDIHSAGCHANFDY